MASTSATTPTSTNDGMKITREELKELMRKRGANALTEVGVQAGDRKWEIEYQMESKRADVVFGHCFRK